MKQPVATKEWIEGEAKGYYQQDAPLEAVEYVLAQPVQHPNYDGRSQWMWIRLPDGDLVLAVYPQGKTYFATEKWRTI